MAPVRLQHGLKLASRNFENGRRRQTWASMLPKTAKHLARPRIPESDFPLFCTANSGEIALGCAGTVMFFWGFNKFNQKKGEGAGLLAF